MQRRRFLQLGAMGLVAGVAPHSLRGAHDDPKMQLRGLTVDAARLVEKPEYYRHLIDFCQDWKLNALLFRLTDDQGSAFRFASHPELVTHDHALSPAEARSLAEYGHSRGVVVIPEVESFGHTTYITSVPKWSHLADTPSGPGARNGFFGISPIDPDSLRLISDLYKEVAQAFRSPWLHGGCDEVNWGASEQSQKALQMRSRAEIWAGYLNSLDFVCGQLGKRLIVWGDYVAHKEPDILPLLNPRIVVMDWQYYETGYRPLADTAKRIIFAGKQVIGAPALISCEWGPRAGEPTLRNVDAFADAYRGLDDSHAMGVIVTNWMPSRYLQDSLWDAFAYAAVALNEGSEEARQRSLRRFVEKFYGAAWNDDWKRAFEELYRITPGRTCARNWKVPRLPLPSTNDDELKRNLNPATPLPDPRPYADLVVLASGLRKTARKHHDAFDSWALSIEYLAYVVKRETGWTELARESGNDDQRSWPEPKLIAQVAGRDRAMLARLEAEWNRGRFDDSVGKRDRMFGLTSYDQLVLQVRLAAEYAEQLAKDESRIKQLLGWERAPLER